MFDSVDVHDCRSVYEVIRVQSCTLHVHVLACMCDAQLNFIGVD